MRLLKAGAFLSIIGVALAAGSLAGLVVWVYRRPHELIGGTFNEDPYPFDWPPEPITTLYDWPPEPMTTLYDWLEQQPRSAP